jgi:hypothetical protein
LTVAGDVARQFDPVPARAMHDDADEAYGRDQCLKAMVVVDVNKIGLAIRLSPPFPLKRQMN